MSVASTRRLQAAAVGVMLSACLAGERSEVILPPDGLALDSTGSQERIYLPDSLHLIHSVGGTSDRDTTLIDPYLMASDEERVYLFEAENRIVAFDTSGALRWMQGEAGGGPGEYRNPRDLKLGPDGRLWLVDPDAGRLTVVDPGKGRVHAMLRMKIAYSPAIVPLPNGFALFPEYDPRDIVYFSEQGDTTGSGTIPWGALRQVEALSRQFRTAVDPKTGRWVLGLISGNGWFAFDGTGPGSARRFYVEPTRFPPVVRTYYERGSVGTQLVRTPASALDIQLKGDTVFILFDGQEPDRRRKVDLYSWESGKYLGSLRLPVPADNISVTGRYLGVYSSRPVPKLSFYLRTRPPVGNR